MFPNLTDDFRASSHSISHERLLISSVYTSRTRELCPSNPDSLKSIVLLWAPCSEAPGYSFSILPERPSSFSCGFTIHLGSPLSIHLPF